MVPRTSRIAAIPSSLKKISGRFDPCIIRKISMDATMAIIARVNIIVIFVWTVFELINKSKDAWANEKERTTEIVIILPNFSISRKSHKINDVIIKPVAEIRIPVLANTLNFLFSSKIELQIAERLKPPSARVVRRILISIFPKSPVMKEKIPT